MSSLCGPVPNTTPPGAPLHPISHVYSPGPGYSILSFSDALRGAVQKQNFRQHQGARAVQCLGLRNTLGAFVYEKTGCSCLFFITHVTITPMNGSSKRVPEDPRRTQNRIFVSSTIHAYSNAHQQSLSRGIGSCQQISGIQSF